MSSNYNGMKKEELIEALNQKDEVLNKQNETLNQQSEKLQNVESDMDLLKQMILEMKQNQENKKESKVEVHENKFEDDIVKIGSCLVGRHILCDNMRNEVVDLADFGDIASISVKMLDSVMTVVNKELFRNGLVYFLDDRLYDRYSIRKSNVLNDETFDEMYKLPTQEMFKEINKLTDNGTNRRVLYMVYWKIVQNIADGRHGYQDRNKENELTAFFKTNISNSINLLQCAKQLEYK